MARLRTLKPLVSALPPRIGFAPGDRKGFDRQRADLYPWRAWYKTTRWQKLRQQILIRDAYTCQRTGRVCAGKYPAPDSPVVDHKVPHRGDPALFWDPNNLWVLSKAYHDGAKQAEERAAEFD